MGTLAVIITMVFVVVAVLLFRRVSKVQDGYRGPKPAPQRETSQKATGPPKTGETIDAYLERLPVTQGESDLLAKWKSRNETYNAHRSDTYYDVLTGSKSEVRSKILKEVTHTYTRHQDEVWGMITEGSTSCFYKWGVNAYGAQVYRFGDDRFAYVHVSVMADA
jgi:hypothetical protein